MNKNNRIRFVLIIGFVLGLAPGWFLSILNNSPTSGTTIYPTRPEMQMFLREHYGYMNDIDGDIGGGSNDAWLLYEEDLMNYDQARYIERMGGGE